MSKSYAYNSFRRPENCSDDKWVAINAWEYVKYQSISRAKKCQFVKCEIMAARARLKKAKMGAPHNHKRIGETWDANKLALVLKDILVIKDFAVISGGWAWHFMTPVGHEELKHAHDHKDLDIIVQPKDTWNIISLLLELGYQRCYTRHDCNTFFRCEKHSEEVGKIVIDVFIEDVPFIEAQGVKVVEPEYLLSLYGIKHMSESCFAVTIARELLSLQINPVDNPHMADYNKFKSNKEK